jgi:hypothetical protein
MQLPRSSIGAVKESMPKQSCGNRAALLLVTLTLVTLYFTAASWKDNGLGADLIVKGNWCLSVSSRVPVSSNMAFTSLCGRLTRAVRPSKGRAPTRCSSATLLGAWENETFVPLPFEALTPFLAEMRGNLSQAAAMMQEDAEASKSASPSVPVPVPTLPLERFTDIAASANSSFSFSPPCYYHFYAAEEIHRLFAGKRAFFIGDSNTRAMVLALLTVLDPHHRAPYDEQTWFNSSGLVSWPHVEAVDYFFREDGTILFKSGSRLLQPGEAPTQGFSFRLSFLMHHVSKEIWLASLSIGSCGTFKTVVELNFLEQYQWAA